MDAYKIILAGESGVGKSTIYEFLLNNIESGGTLTYFSFPDSTTGQQWDKWLFSVPGRKGKKIKVSHRAGNTQNSKLSAVDSMSTSTLEAGQL